MRNKKILSLLLTAATVLSTANAAIAQDTDYTYPYGDKEIMANIATDGWIGNIFSSGAVTTKVENDKTVITSYDESKLKAAAKSRVQTFTNNTKLNRLIFNVNYCRALTDSKTVDSAAWDLEYDNDGNPVLDENGEPKKTPTVYTKSSGVWFDNMRALQNSGIDWLKDAVEAAKDENIEAWVSLRMNDSHYLATNGAASKFVTDHSEYQINATSKRLDFAKAPVRNYMKNYITELARDYDINGIELDFLRDVQYFSNADTDESRKVMSDWLKEVRASVDEARQGTKIYGRVYITEEKSKQIGLDAAQWIADGSVDGIIISGYDDMSGDYPVKEWRESIAAKNTENNEYKLIVGGSNYIGCSQAYNQWGMFTDPNTLKGIASSAYAQGADGVYTFNMYNISDSYYTEVKPDGTSTSYSGSQDRFTAKYNAFDPEKCEIGQRNYVYDMEQQKYPMNLSDSFSFTLNTGTAPSAGYYTVRVGVDSKDGYLDDNISVAVNGEMAAQLRDIPTDPGFSFLENGNGYRPRDISQTAPRVMQFEITDLSKINNGENTVTLTNSDSSKPQSVLWLEIVADGTENAEPAQSDYCFYAAKNLTAERSEDGNVILNWTNQGAANTAGIKVLRRSLAESSFTEIARIENTLETYSDTNASASVSYIYKLQYAYDDENIKAIDSNSATCILTNSDFAVLGTDMQTGTHWEGKYGNEGYTIFGYEDGWQKTYTSNNPKLFNYPANIGKNDAQTALVNVPEYVKSYTISGYGGRPTAVVNNSAALDKPEWLSDTSVKTMILNSNDGILWKDTADSPNQHKVSFELNDDEQHIVTAYFIEASTSNCTSLPIYLYNGNDEIVSQINIVPGDYKNGGYIRFKVKGNFSIMYEGQKNLKQGARYGFTAFFFDEMQTAEKTFADSKVKAFDVNGYDTAVDGEYAYTLIDNKTVAKISLRTGEEAARYTEKNDLIEFAKDWSAYSGNTSTKKRFITASNGIVSVALAKCDNGNGVAMSSPIACRLIDFSTSEPKAHTFRYMDREGASSIQLYGSYIYVTTYELMYTYDVSKILANPDIYDTKIANSLSDNENPAKAGGGRNTAHLYGKDELGRTQYTDESGNTVVTRPATGRIASLNITWGEEGKGYAVFAPINESNTSASVAIAEMYFNNGNPVWGGNCSTIQLGEMVKAAGINAAMPADAVAAGNYICILNKPNDGTDTCILIYDYKNSYIPSYCGKLIPDEGCEYTAIEEYNGYLLAGASDGTVRAFDLETQKEIKSYVLSGVPVRMENKTGFVYAQLADNKMALLSRDSIKFVNNKVTAKEVQIADADDVTAEISSGAYQTVTEGDYVYRIVDNNTIQKCSITTGEVISAVTTTDEIATDIAYDGTTFNNTTTRFLSVSNGIVAATLKGEETGNDNHPVGAVLADFNSETPIVRKASTADGTNGSRSASYLSNGYLFVTGGQCVYGINVNDIFASDEAYTITNDDIIANFGSSYSAVIPVWTTASSGKLILPSCNWMGGDGNNSVYVADMTSENGKITVDADNASTISVKSDETGVSKIQINTADIYNNKLYFASNGTQIGDSDSYIGIYNLSDGSYAGKIAIGKKISDFEIASDKLMFTASDNMLHVYELYENSEIKSYSLSGTPGFMSVSSKNAVMSLTGDKYAYIPVEKATANDKQVKVILYGNIINNTYLPVELNAFMSQNSADGALKSIKAADITADITDDTKSAQKISIEFDVDSINDLKTRVFLWTKDMTPIFAEGNIQ